MKKTKIKFDSIIIIALFILCFIPYLNLGIVSSYFIKNFIYYYLFGSIILFISLIVKNKMLIQKRDILILSLSIAFCLFGYIHNNVSLGNVLTIICSILYLYYFRKRELNNQKTLLYICIAASILYVCISTNVVKSFYSYSSSLNPNMVAQILFIVLVIINHLSNSLNGEKAVSYITTILILLGIYNCESRSVLFASLLYLLLSIIVNKKIKKTGESKKNKTIYWLIIIIGLLVPFILVNMYSNSYSINISFFDKNLYSGREKIWIIVLNELRSIKNIIFGIPTYKYYDLIFTHNLHNIYLTVLANYGIIYFIIYYGYLYRNYEKIVSNKTQNIYLCLGIIMILLIGSMENIIFSTELNFLFCSLFSLGVNPKYKKVVSIDEPN